MIFLWTKINERAPSINKKIVNIIKAKPRIEQVKEEGRWNWCKISYDYINCLIEFSKVAVKFLQLPATKVSMILEWMPARISISESGFLVLD